MKPLLKNDVNQWGVISRIFHWFMALLVIGQLYIGFTMTALAASPAKYDLYKLHKSFGLIVLSLVGLRLLWRSLFPTPALPSQDILTRLSAPVLYLMMLIMPLSGIIMTLSAGYPIPLFNWLTIPAFIEKNFVTSKGAALIHNLCGTSFVALIGLHMGAACYHQWGRKNNLLRRMIKGQ
ncbi:cytochrome b [Candidatus Odyssella thessalonicensis]|uniref:cytochrome b n=1 Tax=Candidatus Odyssella thessalonicensis TaxID=84647 RepID=UPI000225C1FC|nr:cytochrome b [Candidatus Odyssella thessalonicensis]